MSSVPSIPDSPSRVEAEVSRIRGLVNKRQFAIGLAAASALRLEVPENRDVLYLVAVNQRYLSRFAEALTTLEQLEHSHPMFARLFQERGHCHHARGETGHAIEAYRRAVTLNGALIVSWQALSKLYRAAGQIEHSRSARAQVSRLEILPPPVLKGAGMLAEGDILGADRVLRRFLQVHGTHIEAMRLLAQVGIQLDGLDEAEFLLESVLEFAPDYHLARYDHALVLSKRQKHAAALEQAGRLLEIEPENRAFRTMYANASVGVGNHEQALRLYNGLIEGAPGNPTLHLSAGHAQKTLGRRSEAIQSYRQAARVQPDCGDAYWSLANLKTYRFTQAEIAQMRVHASASTTQPADRYHLCFALGKALEDCAEYEESFHYYSRGNELKKTECCYDPAVMERSLRRQVTVCTPTLFASREGAGCIRADPIFIVGLPRAGSTLIEQILASHSKVEGTMELPDIPRLTHRLQGLEGHSREARYPDVLTTLTPEQLRRFGDRYIADTQVYRESPPRPFFIDKMPNNFRHLGLIHLILPNARIIDVRREPMACCFSNFKQLFASGQEFTYSLQDIARYYRGYVELMAHWDSVLPGRILRVQHERLVEDLEGNVRRILSFLGLEFEPSCLEFHKTARSVRTASSEQVRQPVFKEGLQQWRHFEPWLHPLKQALGELAP